MLFGAMGNENWSYQVISFCVSLLGRAAKKSCICLQKGIRSELEAQRAVKCETPDVTAVDM